MIKEYFRPESLPEALALLDRTNIKTIPLAGGNGINKWGQDDIAVVDLQKLKWDHIKETDLAWEVGATTTLQTLVENISLPEALREAIRREATFNVRNMATIGGTIAKQHNLSPLTVALLALNAQMIWEPEGNPIFFSEWYVLREKHLERKLIRSILIPKHVSLYFSTIGRSPEDSPLIMVSVAEFSPDRIRVAIGGPNYSPTVVIDGSGKNDVENTVSSFLIGKGNELASDSYLQDVGSVLTLRLIKNVQSSGKE